MEMLAKNGNLKIELLSGMKSFEEFLIHAKPIIDEMDSAYVNIVSPKMETDNCKQIVSLVRELSVVIFIHIIQFRLTHSK